MKFIAVIALMFMLNACSFFYNEKPLQKSPWLPLTVAYGPPPFRAGYADGCETAIASYGNSVVKTFNTIKKNPAYQDDPMYNQVWKDAFNFCYMKTFMGGLQVGGQSVGRQLF